MNDIWNQLEADFERRDAAPLELPSDIQVEEKGFTPKERFQEWMLNGTAPLLLTSALAFTLLVSEELHSKLGLELLIIFPLIWILRATFFSANRPSLLKTIVASLTAGAFIELFSTGTHIFADQSQDHSLRDFYAAYLIQRHLESYFSYPHIFAYIAIGVLSFLLVRRVEGNNCWVDLKPPSRFRFATSYLFVAGIPFIAAATIFTLIWQHQWSETERQWIAKQSAIASNFHRDHEKKDSFWQNTVESLKNEDGELTTTDTETLAKVESLALEKFPKLLVNPNFASGIDSLRILGLVADNLDKIKSPEKVALAFVLHPLNGPDTWNGKRDLALANGLLPYLAKAPLGEINSMEAPFRTPDTHQLTKMYGEYASRIIYSSLEEAKTSEPSRELRRKSFEVPQTMQLLGVEFETTPIEILARRTLREDLRWWMQIEAHLPGKTLDEAHNVIQKVGHPDGTRVSYQVASIMYPGRDANTYLTLAILIPKLRAHHEQTGRWPESLPKFAESVGLKLKNPRIKFDSTTGRITYIPTVHYYKPVTTSWVLK